MNIAVRKLSLLEKSLTEKEDCLKSQGYATNVIDVDLKKRVTCLMGKIKMAQC